MKARSHLVSTSTLAWRCRHHQIAPPHLPRPTLHEHTYTQSTAVDIIRERAIKFIKGRRDHKKVWTFFVAMKCSDAADPHDAPSDLLEMFMTRWGDGAVKEDLEPTKGATQDTETIEENVDLKGALVAAEKKQPPCEQLPAVTLASSTDPPSRHGRSGSPLTQRSPAALPILCKVIRHGQRESVPTGKSST